MPGVERLSGPNLDEDNRLSVQRDEVNFAAAIEDAAADNPQPLLFQKSGRPVLAFSAEQSPQPAFHASSFGWRQCPVPTGPQSPREGRTVSATVRGACRE